MANQLRPIVGETYAKHGDVRIVVALHPLTVEYRSPDGKKTKECSHMAWVKWVMTMNRPGAKEPPKKKVPNQGAQRRSKGPNDNAWILSEEELDKTDCPFEGNR